MSLRAKLYIGLVLAAGAAILCHGMWTWSSVDAREYLIYVLIALVASNIKISLPSVKGTMSMNFVFVLIAISRFSLGQTLVMGCLGIFAQTVLFTKSRRNPLRAAFNVAGMACAIQVAYWVHYARHIEQLMLTATAYFVANTLMTAAVIGLTEGKNVFKLWHDAYFWSFPNYLAGAAAAWVVSVATKLVGWESALLLIPILYIVHQSHNLYASRLEEARRRAEEQRAHAEEIAGLQRRSIETLALAIEAKDSNTHDHLERVEVYAVEVAKELGLGEVEMEALRAAALLHDIGKLAVPEYIISKPGKLSRDEFEKMKTHTVVGAEIVERIRFPYSVAPIVRAHHEKWDGSGYPDGLAGEQIPMGARILAAVDTLDALSADRQYRRAIPLDEAIQIIRSESGKSFDPRVVEILARRYVELERMARTSHRIAKLPTECKVERGDAPAAGFETTGSELAQLHTALEEGHPSEKLVTRLARCSERADLAETLRDRLPILIPYHAMAVYRKRGELLIAEIIDGPGFRCLVSTEVRLGEGLSGWVVENGKAIVNGNPAVEPGYVDEPEKYGSLRSALSIPLATSQGIIGAVSLYREETDAFTHEHLGALKAISPALAEALETTGTRTPHPVSNLAGG
jgi:putative nucleotidyltransferase with HDIG domain